MAGVAGFVFGVGVPGGIKAIHLKRHLVHRDAVANIVKDEKLGFRAHIGGVADAGGFQIGLGLDRGAARVTLIGFHGVGFDHVAMDTDGFFGIERVDIGAFGIKDQLHVGLIDGFPARDRGSIKHEPFVDEILIHQIGDDGHMLQLAARVGKTDIDVFNVFILDKFEKLFFAHLLRLSPWMMRI